MEGALTFALLTPAPAAFSLVASSLCVWGGHGGGGGETSDLIKVTLPFPQFFSLLQGWGEVAGCLQVQMASPLPPSCLKGPVLPGPSVARNLLLSFPYRPPTPPPRTC